MIKPDIAALIQAMSNDKGNLGQAAAPQTDPRASAIEELMQGQGNMSRMRTIDPSEYIPFNDMWTGFPVDDTYPDDSPDDPPRWLSPQEMAIQEMPDNPATDEDFAAIMNAEPQPNLTDPNEDVPPERMTEDETQAFLRQIMGDKKGNIPTPRRNPLRR